MPFNTLAWPACSLEALFKPLKKIAGSKTVEQVKNAASAARASAACFNYKAGIGNAMRKMKDIK